MKQEILSLKSVVPFVRYTEDVYIPDSRRQINVSTYDHRLFYIVKGTASIEVNGLVYTVSPGTVLYWMSGTTYIIRPDAGSVLHVIAINFDFTENNADTVQYLPMVSPSEYDPEKRMENVLFEDAVLLNAPVILADMPIILPYLRAMLRESAVPQSLGGLQLRNLMHIILVHLYREASQRQLLQSTIQSSKAILDYVHGHFSEDLDNKKLAEIFNYHPNYISQLIAAQTGIPLHKYLLKVRIRQALYLLETTDASIGEIARQVGFRSTSYFCQYFKQCTGHVPTKFRIK